MKFTLSDQPIDTRGRKQAIRDPSAGGYVEFEGRVRDRARGKIVTALSYEAYRELALAEGEQILSEARARFGVLDLESVHRTGWLEVGEVAVWIGVIGVHRGEAFRACRHCIDEIKRRLPIWKRETYRDGSSEWIGCSHPDRAGPHISR